MNPRSSDAERSSDVDQSDLLGGGVSRIDIGRPSEVAVGREYDEASEDLEPNSLHVTIHQARKLPAMDRDMLGRKTSSDPVVKLSIEGYKSQDTAVIRKELNPVWNEKIIFKPLVDASLSLTVEVEDYNDILSRTFMGKAVIPLVTLADKKAHKKWHKLFARTMEPDGQDRGEIELTVEWMWDPDVAIAVRKQTLAKERNFSTKFKKAALWLAGDQESEPSEDDENDVSTCPSTVSLPGT